MTKRYDIITGEKLYQAIMASIIDIDAMVTTWTKSTVIESGKIADSLDCAVVHSSRQTRIIVDMLREAAINADLKSGAEPNTTMMLAIDMLRYVSGKLQFGTSINEIISSMTELDVVERHLANMYKRASARDMSNVINSTNDVDEYGQMVEEALEIMGADGRIFFELGDMNRAQVELRTGHYFDTACPMLAAVHTQEWRAHDVKVAVIDGMCESVAELDSLLSAAHETKQPLVIFARQFSDDVIHTISVNNRRKTLNVLPVVVPFDLDSANILKDIAVVTDSNLTSSLEGKLISTIDFSQLCTVDEIHTSMTGIVIDHKLRDITNLDVHTKVLREQMTTNALVAPILAKRLRSLSARTVFIRVPRTKLRNASGIDRSLRRVKAASAGVLVKRTIEQSIASITDLGLRSIMTKWTSSLQDVEPMQSIISAIHFVKTNVQLIASTGAIIV